MLSAQWDSPSKAESSRRAQLRSFQFEYSYLTAIHDFDFVLTEDPKFLALDEQALGSWFAENHAEETELWVGYFKKHRDTGRQVLSWPLAAGALHTTKGQEPLEQGHRSQFLKQRAGSRIPAAQRLPSAESIERDAIPLSAEFAARLAEASASADWHSKQPPEHRRAAEDWLMSAKQEATRERRFGVLIQVVCVCHHYNASFR
ncbi:hypothetical protein DFH07DRAFT_1062839 [Mycena maculata]|uniref:Uncharacterized protein n=1 Tax=Mycena maculata TaxID=230809 RepID=A0AAD7IQ48_9AGAR|nr:hypothetical protein DFH07DRAFT_1062839 [Mycena maculata]